MTWNNYFLWISSILLESLPISSSGHIALLKKKLATTEVNRAIEELMHIPNMGIAFIYLLNHSNLFVSHFSLYDWVSFAGAVTSANLITGSLYLIIKNRALVSLSTGFLITGSVLVSLYFAPHSVVMKISLAQGIIIGCAQSCSLLPGISRLALTTSSGIWLGLHPIASLLFSIACQFGLLLAAISRVLLVEKNVLSFFKLTRFQTIGIVVTSAISYLFPVCVEKSLTNGTIVLFGYYLLTLGILTKVSRKKKSNQNL